MTFARILIATDGSGNAERALDTAVALARTHGASLTILHTIISGPLPDGLVRWARVEHLIPDEGGAQPRGAVYGPVATLVNRDSRVVPNQVREAVGQAVLSHAEGKAKAAGVTGVHVQLAGGDPAEAIAQALEGGGYDLLVLGTRGHGTLRGLLVGSVSHKALGLHACPVLVVP
jgi:nucleotide-binding universal stress UspA family protein